MWLMRTNTSSYFHISALFDKIMFMITLETEFDVNGQDAAWKNLAAKQLNVILARALFVSSDPYLDPIDREFMASALSIVQRVAEFENIEVLNQHSKAAQYIEAFNA
jgi:hypothetical protein